MTAPVSVRAATAADRTHVERLLRSEGLPLEGLAEHFEHFVVAEVAGAVIAAAGLEIHSRDGLLRSVVVTLDHRSTGVAQLLFRTIVENARRNRLRALYLLTTTAEDYFTLRGFSRVLREHVPETVKQSREFVDACPASAIAMRYALTEA